MIHKENEYYYGFARTEDGKPIHISSISKEDRHRCRYFCYGCDKELFPVLGEKREKHFRHEKGAECDPNRYLHEHAKSELKKRFDENETFIVQYHATQICEKAEQCVFRKQYNWPECEHEGLYSIDLKKHYDTCTPEKGYYQELPDGKKRYVADLKLTNSQKPAQKPVCIEVWVAHECTEDKKQNGGRIIEIKINDEKDIARPIIESDDENLPIRFFNFKNPVSVEPSIKFLHIKLMTGLKQQFVPVIDITPCYEGLEFDTKGLNEIILSTDHISSGLAEDIYAVYCHNAGIPYPHPFLCDNLYYHEISKRHYCKVDKYINCASCKRFKYSKEKEDEILEKNKEIVVWTSSQDGDASEVTE